MRLATLLLCCCLWACAHRVTITSEPPGATITVRDKRLGPAPQEVRFWWYPFRPMKVKVSAEGYRSLTMKLNDDLGPLHFTRLLFTGRWAKMVGLRPAANHEVMLIRQHGPAGTWTSEDVKP